MYNWSTYKWTVFECRNERKFELKNGNFELCIGNIGISCDERTVAWPRTTDAQWSLFYWNPELLGLGRQIGQINSGAFGVFSAELSAPILVQWVPIPCFPLSSKVVPEGWALTVTVQPSGTTLLSSHYFYKKTKPLYPHLKYLFGIGI